MLLGRYIADLGELRAIVVADMAVRLAKAGHDRGAAAVDNRRPIGWNLIFPLGDALDPVALHRNLAGKRITAGTIENKYVLK